MHVIAIGMVGGVLQYLSIPYHVTLYCSWIFCSTVSFFRSYFSLSLAMPISLQPYVAQSSSGQKNPWTPNRHSLIQDAKSIRNSVLPRERVDSMHWRTPRCRPPDVLTSRSLSRWRAPFTVIAGSTWRSHYREADK